MKFGPLDIRYHHPLSLEEWAEFLVLVVFAAAVLCSVFFGDLIAAKRLLNDLT